MKSSRRSRRGVQLRFALGGTVVILFAAATTAVAGLLQFKQLATDISRTPPIKQAQVMVADPGSPQTLLLIGSDHRAGTPWASANTDTMMLVRLDPSSETINVLSIPRDLEVELPQGGAIADGKLNAAYSIGGPNLLVKVLQQQVFPGVQINHIIDLNFGGFEALVNAVGCVYVDVDHRYYNNTAVTDYSSINLQPGYQRLCGSDALAFVRFRHTDNDIVRNARQQDFLRWVKSEFSAGYLIANRDRLLRLFGEHTETDADLHTVDGLINLFNLVAFSSGHAFKQIPFPAILGTCGSGSTPCYVIADPAAERQAFDEFMTPSLPPRPAPRLTPAGQAAANTGAHAPTASAPSNVGVTGDPSGGKAQAAALGSLGMPVYYPELIASGSSYCSSAAGNCPVEIASPGSYPRRYLIRDTSAAEHVAYRMTLAINPALGEYYGIQGTTWQTPPILNRPSQTRVVNGRELLLYGDSQHLNLVAWRTSHGVYWISNTLTDTLSANQMVAIAASLTPA